MTLVLRKQSDVWKILAARTGCQRIVPPPVLPIYAPAMWRQFPRRDLRVHHLPMETALAWRFRRSIETGTIAMNPAWLDYS
jgi:hypothetical protein